MIYLIGSFLILSLIRNYNSEMEKWDLHSDKEQVRRRLKALEEEHAELQKRYDDLSDEYRDFVDFVNEEEIKLQNEMGEKLIKSLQDEIMTQALLSMKPNAEA
jgi:predicted nuclease with TOPRIM domain